MKGLSRVWIILSLLVLAASIGFVIYLNRGGTLPQASEPSGSSDRAIREAVQNAISSNRESVLAFLISDVEVSHIVYSDDNRTALVWLAERDPDSGDLIGREPGLAVAYNKQGVLASPGGWEIVFEMGDKSLDINALPPELVTEDLRARFEQVQQVQTAAPKTYTGYKLPWSTAFRIRLTGSIGHFLSYKSCSEISCRYAYDFWNPDPNNRNFPLLASKGGTVQAFRESCQNNDRNCVNYLVLRDDSTNPPTYQLYYHIAHNSVPDNLALGTYVQQGQYIANVDNTGYSTGPHLHFHVYENKVGSWSWGYSVRIIFQDVPFNGGEPRTCAETVNYPGYGTECSMGPDGKKLTKDDDILVSGNTGADPPSGSLDTPAPWGAVTGGNFAISGKASDKQGIARVEMMLNWDGTWKSVGDATLGSGSFQGVIDLCKLGVPNGPFSLAVRIWDIEGNWVAPLTGIRQLFNNSPCSTIVAPVPSCPPASNEVSLYTGPSFTGTCRKFTAGYHNTLALGVLGDNSVRSIQVGSGTRAVLFDLNEDLNRLIPAGRLETFTAADANLADNYIGAGTTSALWVNSSQNISDPSLIEPYIKAPGSQHSNTANPKSADSLVLSWKGGMGATLFSSSLTKNGAVVASMPAAKTQSWSVGTLAPGNYTWTVTACSGITSCSSGVTNNSTVTFTVDAASLPASGGVTAPTGTWNFDQSGQDWVASGLWHHARVNRLKGDLSAAPTGAWAFNTAASNTSDPTWKAGDLTSPPITVTTNGAYFLRFRFFSGVEGPSYAGQTVASTWWDQRRVQISVNGGPFKDLSGGLVSGDMQNKVNFWPSMALPLGNYNAGQVLRVRFHYDALDSYYNNGFGWAVDDISVTNQPFDPGCRDANDAPSNAAPIALGEKKSERICPMGDIDTWSFSGTAGMNLRVDLDAKALDRNNPLDAFITLLDSTGRNVIAANDDEDAANSEPRFRDPLLVTQLPYTGTYYLQVKAWDHPGAGGANYAYNLTLSQEQTSATRPVVKWIKPPDPKRLPTVPFIVEAGASDPAGSGIRQVDFFWHSADWVNGQWIRFASDTTPADGWFGIFNPSMDTTGSAFYFMATSNSGSTNGVFAADMAPDRTMPVSAMHPLPARTNSTAIQLNWDASDQQDDIAYFNLQYRFNGSAWSDINMKIPAAARSAWFLGQDGRYEFRLRAVDANSNQEPWPQAAEAATTVVSACVNDANEPGNNQVAGAEALSWSKPITLIQCRNDIDWASFKADAGQKQLLIFNSLSGGAAVKLNMYGPDGKLIHTASAPQIGEDLRFFFTAPVSGTYTLEMSPLNDAVYGSDAKYQVYAGQGFMLRLPLVAR